MDRNLGAYNKARSSTDCWSYGNYYQWGRASDGHEYASSGQTSTIATTPLPNAGNTWDGLFILRNSNPNNWLSSLDNTLWQGVNGANNPCPAGYRLPSQAELNNERLSWSSNNAAGAFASPLKLPMAGHRDRVSGDLGGVGTGGIYWSTNISTVSAGNVLLLLFDSSTANTTSSSTRAFGRSVRCIKN